MTEPLPRNVNASNSSVAIGWRWLANRPWPSPSWPDPGDKPLPYQPVPSMVARRAERDCLQVAACGWSARRSSRARSIALSTVCQGFGARGLSEGSSSSQEVSRSLIRAFAPARSPLSTRAAVSTTMALNEERSPRSATLAALALPAGPDKIAPNRSSEAMAIKSLRRRIRGSDRSRASGILDGTCRLRRSVLTHAEIRHQGHDDGEERGAGHHRTQAHAAIGLWLGQQVAQGSAQRPGEHVGDPEGQDCVGTEIPGEAHRRDQGQADHHPEPET